MKELVNATSLFFLQSPQVLGFRKVNRFRVIINAETAVSVVGFLVVKREQMSISIFNKKAPVGLGLFSVLVLSRQSTASSEINPSSTPHQSDTQ